MSIRDQLQPYVTSRSLRFSNQGLLAVPRSRLQTKGDCGFELAAPKPWNSLLLDLRSVVDFKKHVKTYVFRLEFK